MRFCSLLIGLLFIVQISLGQRISQTINSAWNFTIGENETQTVNIPHTWNANDAFTDKGDYFRGEGFYSKDIEIPAEWEAKQLFIKGEGANQVVKIWINDSLVGTHRCGYTAFTFDITKYIEFGKTNHIKISCDNSYNQDIPPLSADFTFYGGIYRDLYLIATNHIHIDVANAATGSFKIQTPSVSDEEANIIVSANLCNETESTQNCMVRTSIANANGIEVLSTTQKIKLGKGKTPIKASFLLKNPQLWSPESPNLYTATISVKEEKTGKNLDLQQSTFGCRWFYADPEKGFFLNGKPYKLMGVNRHQDFKGLGNALPNRFHEMDMKNIKQMGCNFIRIAHYPQDPDIYDWCDKLGIIAWSEIPIVNQITMNESFTSNALQAQREHVEQNFNHPSVVMWGYMNEVLLRQPFNSSTTKDDREKYYKATLQLAQSLNDETKEIDPDRLTVMALHGSQIYNTTQIADVPDIIGWNLYMGWYGGKMEELGNFLDQEHKKHPNRPILISEYGPGADIRIQTNNPQAWDFSEAYQIKLHHSYVSQVMARPFMLGMAAWNYADFGSAGRVDAIPNLNQKGLLTFDRDTKDVYHYYQARLLNEPFLFIGGKHRKCYCTDSTETISVPVFSNLKSINILIDGRQVQTIEPQDGLAYAKIQVSEGTHEIMAISGDESFRRSVTVINKATMINQLEQHSIAINVGSHCDFFDETTNEMWIADQQYQPGQWGYLGGSVYQKNPSRAQGTDNNILGTTNDPLYQTMRKGIEAYRFDVKNGSYRVSMLFTEPNSKASTKLIYDLGGENATQNEESRIFSISINGETVKSRMNLAHEFGINRAAEITFTINTKEGIDIHFERVEGEAVISGIKLEKLY